MKADLDRLMRERDLAGIIIAIDHNYSAPLDYLVGTVHITKGLAMKKVGEPPVLFVNPMEVEEAAVTGCTVYTFNDLGWLELLKEHENRNDAEVIFWKRCLQKVGIESGNIAIYGVSDLHIIIELVRLLENAYPEYHFQGELGRTIFEVASITKDADELARIRSVAERTSEVLQATWDFIGIHHEKDGEVVNIADVPLTIGAVKAFIRRELLDRGLEDTGMIFAQGRDAGFPHSRGQADMVLKVGESIVFDLFPRELGGGYHHDVTRTWCIGYAPDNVRQIYDTVKEAFDIAIESYGLNKPTHLMQEAVLDYFEGKGHPTSRSDPNEMNGYVHSLGHGLGLNVHENPRITHLQQTDHFEIGNVVTIEPGLYYPDEGLGVRIEDTVYIDEAGELITLTDFRKDLVLPLSEG